MIERKRPPLLHLRMSPHLRPILPCPLPRLPRLPRLLRLFLLLRLTPLQSLSPKRHIMHDDIYDLIILTFL